MRNTHTDHEVVATPEWVTAARRDRLVDSRIGGGWQVSASPAARGASFTDFQHRVMAVPTGDSDLAQAVRFHELLHARFSPSSVPAELLSQMGIPAATVAVAEEMRMNLIGFHSDNDEVARLIPQLQDGTEAKAADFAAANDDFRAAVYLMYSTYHLDCFRHVSRRLRMKPEWNKAVKGITKHLRNTYGTRRGANGRQWARGAQRTEPIRYQWAVGHAGLREVVIPLGFVSVAMPIANEIEQIIADGGIGDSKMSPSASKKGDTDEQDAGEPTPDTMPERYKNSTAEWAGMRMGITSLTEPTANFIGKRRRPSVTGKYPRRPDRLLTDPERRIFSEEARGAGGVVVFDCSGSMGVDHEVVRQAVSHFAGATVLAYSYNGAGVANAWVLARNGRMVSQDEMENLPLNHGNGLDGVALRWAVRQRKTPKDFVLWVSDFGVTGVSDAWGWDYEIDCANLCRRHNIVQVNNCDEAISALANMKRTGSLGRRSWQSERLTNWVEKLEAGDTLIPLVGVSPTE